MNQPSPDEIRRHWNARATLGAVAGTQDLLSKRLEHAAILRALPPSARVLEVGCGRGELAYLMATTRHAFVTAIDNAAAMIEAASREHPHPCVSFFEGSLGHVSLPWDYQVIVTERMIINLPTWAAQRAMIDQIAQVLEPGGRYLMCENSRDGLAVLNRWRAALGLPAIIQPWHNRYLRDDELATITSLRLVHCHAFSSTYYFLSRVLNAKLAQLRGRSPRYDSWLNRLAMWCPSVGPWAQGRLWIWEKP